MNVEDSYEGAVRRLNRLRHAGLDLAPPPEPDESDRVRDLEELASLACDENERLTQELAGARGEVERLQRLTATLQEMLAGAQSDDEPLSVPKQRGAAFYFFAVVIVGGGIAALLLLRPWERRSSPVAVVAAPIVAAPVAVAPVAVAPAPLPIIPKAEPIIPKAAATIPKVEPPRAAAPKPARHHAAKQRRHKQHKRGSMAKSGNKLDARGDDPLGGLGM